MPAEVQTFHVENSAVELLSQKRFAHGETLRLEPWGAVILRESEIPSRDFSAEQGRQK